MEATAPSEATLMDEIQRLRARIAVLELERQIPNEILEKAPIMISVMRAPDFVYELVNPAFQALAPGKQFLGCRFADVWAEIPDPLVEILQNVIATGRMFQLEDASYTIERGPGSPPEVVYVSYSWIPLPGPGGKPDRVLTLAHDVTGSVRQRQQLAELKEAFRTLADNSPDNIDRIDRDSRHLYVNDAAAKTLGLSPESVIGRTNREIGVPDPWAAIWEERVRRVFETGEPLEVEDSFPALHGTRFFETRCAAELAPDGGVVSVLAVSRDITERKRSEQALRESEARERARAAELQAIMEAVPAVVSIARDAECRAIVGNRMARELLRVPSGSNFSKSAPEEERPKSWREVKDGRSLSADELPMQIAARTGQPVRDYELDLVFDDGTARCWLGNAEPLFDEMGRSRGAVGAFVDITERKRNEERLRQTQKLESVGLLAGGIAHDFNNLLTGIMGNASLVLNEVGLDPARRIKDVISSAERAANLTRQLLAYSGKGRFTVRDLDVSDAVNEITSLVEFSIPKSVQLAVNVQRRLPIVRMDPSQLQQILMNLVINAGEAIGEGNPGQITVATSIADIEKPFVDAIGEDVAPGRYVSIAVSDTGSGIDEAKKAKIFDPFFTTKFTGRGLGLAAVAGILRSHRGAITLDSVAGLGSTFRVFLPVAEKRVLGPGEQDENRATILVVDDEGSVRDIIGEVLRRQEYRVLLASDGREALAACEREGGRIDAAVVDVVMPVMGANDLLPELQSRRPEMRILLTSGYSEAEARRLCAAYPGAAFIGKPYTAQQFARAVDALLGITRP